MITIRKMVETDREFILRLSSRFNEFQQMGWRDKEGMEKAQVRIAEEALSTTDQDSDIFIAENADGEALGHLHMKKTVDYFTGEEQGYISSIAVSKEGEGKGIAKRLMQLAEDWSREKGYQQVVLNVFAKK